MLPATLLGYSVSAGMILPHFLGPDDLPWLRVLIEEHERFVERPQRELAERLEHPLPCASPADKRRLATAVLGAQLRCRIAAEAEPVQVRAAVFCAAAKRRRERAASIGEAAQLLGLTPAQIERTLFADIPGERIVAAPKQWPEPRELALRANLMLIQSLLGHAAEVRLELWGQVRPIVRQARLRGLICTARPKTPTPQAPSPRTTLPVAEDGSTSVEQGCLLEISGPLAILKHTRVYGRALGELVPLLAWCSRFRLQARCVLAGEPLLLELASGTPIFPSDEPRRFDSRLEARFSREMGRATRDWDIVREPEAIPAGGSLLFPDFALVRRSAPFERWLLEIVGFWTPNYIEQKMARLRAAHLERFILCIDADRQCTDEELPRGANVVRFRKRVDPQAILAILEAGA